VYRAIIHGDASRVAIAPTAVVNDALLNVESGTIQVDDWAFFGHGVMVLTGTHDFQSLGRDRQASVPTSGRDVSIGEGAWVSSRALILGPCVIGAHAVVAAGAVVTSDVEPYSIVAGVPARVLGRVSPEGDDD
jgi:acetyltransferase-like isoleucine patch superfamily enzyme